MKIQAIPPTLLMTPEVEQRLRHYVELAPGEVSGLGLVDEVAQGFLVSRVFLLEQTCDATETEIDDGALGRLLATLEAEGIDGSRLRLWWHSHADMKCFWSPTDEATVRSLANGDWTTSLVMNRAGERRCRLDLWRPTRVTLDEIPTSVHVDDLDLRETCAREVRQHVRARPVIARGVHAGTTAAPGRPTEARRPQGRVEAWSPDGWRERLVVDPFLPEGLEDGP